MRITVNGTAREVGAAPGTGTARAIDGISVDALVRELTSAQRGVAVAVNGEVVPRSAWPVAVLRDGDRVEVLTAAQGG